MAFIFRGYGHPSVLSSHPTTLEITREHSVTKRGDCILVVRADCGLADLPLEVKRTLSQESGFGELTLRVRNMTFTVQGRGSTGLTFTDPNEIVVRRSGFVSGRTLMVHSNKAAADVPREMVKLLRDPSEVVTIEISAIRRPEQP